MALGGREMDEAVGLEPLLRVCGSDDHCSLKNDDEGVLMDLMVGQALAPRQAKQDDAVGIVI